MKWELLWGRRGGAGGWTTVVGGLLISFRTHEGSAVPRCSLRSYGEGCIGIGRKVEYHISMHLSAASRPCVGEEEAPAMQRLSQWRGEIKIPPSRNEATRPRLSRVRPRNCEADATDAPRRSVLGE